MGFSFSVKGAFSLLALLFLTSLNLCSATRKLAALVNPQPTVLSYHNGPLLIGNLSMNIVWYGKFSLVQRSILLDFLHSLDTTPTPYLKTSPKPSISSWWKTLQSYQTLIPKKPHKISRNAQNPIAVKVQKQTLHESYSLGRFLTRAQISGLAEKASRHGAMVIVITAEDVAVEGFCMSSCAHHGSTRTSKVVYVWIGNSVSQCPGQCAWPFHQPVYGPQSPPLVAPNGDVGADGMVISLASVLAATVTNPYGTGFFQGPASAPLEAVSACPGAYGSGAYPGYAGKVLVDPTTGGSYNAHGVNGRKFLLPALWDPLTSACSTLV
ncbi:hypothetical protein HHK36_028473 [Tetracentron sinense]|uniref:Protein EXORDIUM-like 2 n=1 Tax=Tetracentron sinense TaxID=13715 RepID=A0A835D2M2_TETSI|nr:hypothetical protein HHK36_028473 [Tetracentron sinense]